MYKGVHVAHIFKICFNSLAAFQIRFRFASNSFIKLLHILEKQPFVGVCRFSKIQMKASLPVSFLARLWASSMQLYLKRDSGAVVFQ